MRRFLVLALATSALIACGDELAPPRAEQAPASVFATGSPS